MLGKTEEHAARNALPADAAMPSHETEVKKRERQEEHNRGADTGIVLATPKGDTDMEYTVRENESGRGEARPNKPPMPPHGDKKWQPDEQCVGAVDRNRGEREVTRGSEGGNDVAGIG